MATGPSYGSSTNAYVPNWEASGKLRVSFTRNVKSFALPRYAKMVSTPKPTGYWKQWLNQKAARIIDEKRAIWADGKPRPLDTETEQFNYVQFRCARRHSMYVYGTRTTEAADEDLVEVERKAAAAQRMTGRSVRALAALTTTANWDTSADGNLSANHEATTSALTSTAGVTIGDLSGGSSTDPRIMSALTYASDLMTVDSLGVISGQEMSTYIMMNPTTARKLARSQEIHDYLKSSPWAFDRITGKLPVKNQYGLPIELYGHEVIIDDTVKVTSERKATLAKSYAFPAAAIIMGTRVDGMDGKYDEQNDAADRSASFSTFTIFHHEDFSVEEFNDQENRMLKGYVTEDTAEVLTCPASGFYFQSVFTD